MKFHPIISKPPREAHIYTYDHRVPFLYEESYQWYTSFDTLGELIDRPNPTPALDLLTSICKRLIEDCAWPPNRIHLFGFAQGGSVAVEFGLKWWRSELEKQRKHELEANTPSAAYVPRTLASIVSVCGPLLSYPTVKNLCPTPLLVLHRPPPAETALPSSALTAFKKAYSDVRDTQMGRGEGMPRSKEEWEPVMRFWSERLSKRRMEGLYEVLSGASS